MADKIVLIDGYSLLFRAFFALPLMDNGEGEYTNAVHGFMNMLLKVLGTQSPRYAAVVFDVDKHTFRHEKCDYYKANRPPTPAEFKGQVDTLKELLTAMNFKILQKQGYEADDVLGTVSRICAEQGLEAVIVTGDRDSYQLVGDGVRVLYTKKGITETEDVTADWVREKYGLEPKQLIDVKSLMGDTSDNIPGVAGIGEKTAIKLISAYGNLETLLEKADAELKGAEKRKILEGRDSALESRFLAEIDRYVPIDFRAEECEGFSVKGGMPLLRKLKLRTILQAVAAMEGEEPPQPAPEPREDEISIEFTEVSVSEAKQTVAELMKNAKTAALFAGDYVSFAFDSGRGLYVRRDGDLLTPGLTDEEIADFVSPLLEGSGKIVFHNVKDFPCDMSACRGRAEDTMLAAYCLNPQKNCRAFEDVCVDNEIAFQPHCEAGAVLMLWNRLNKQLEQDGLTNLYRDIELPLSFVLKKMENTGFRVDESYLTELGSRYEVRIDEITKQIYALAGREINLNSPKQLKELLFDEMKLPVPGGKKAASTAAEVLEELAEEYPVCALILEYRKYQKLNSTYVTGLRAQIGADGRIHTCFEQAVTGTGRISSREPNLQNIPVRTAQGREIRRAFIPGEGSVLVDADYSQIELRVLSHMSNDAGMRDAFLNGQDIHARTAAEVFGVPLDEVTPEMRSRAKAVNFGIVYGISDYGLSKNTGVSVWQAGEYIKLYFERYPGIKSYMDEQVRLGKEQGYVSTMFGRRRYLPELSSPSYQMRSFGERAAMNSPIQGTAADIIKLAMVKVADELERRGMRTRLIMQVHDELILEAPADEAEAAGKLLTECMENAVSMAVPLKSEVGTGGDWNECKP